MLRQHALLLTQTWLHVRAGSSLPTGGRRQAQPLPPTHSFTKVTSVPPPLVILRQGDPSSTSRALYASKAQPARARPSSQSKAVLGSSSAEAVGAASDAAADAAATAGLRTWPCCSSCRLRRCMVATDVAAPPSCRRGGGSGGRVCRRARARPAPVHCPRAAAEATCIAGAPNRLHRRCRVEQGFGSRSRRRSGRYCGLQLTESYVQTQSKRSRLQALKPVHFGMGYKSGQL